MPTNYGIARLNFRTSGGGTAENLKTTAWVNAVGAANVSAARRVLINNLFNGLDTDGITSLLGRLWLLAAENAASAAVDLISLQSILLVNSPTFTTDRGYTPNGTTSYVNFQTATTGTQNNASWGFATRTNQAAADVAQGSVSSASSSSNFSIKWSDSKSYWSLNDGDGHTGVTAPTNTVGIYVCSRTAVTTCPMYKDGTSLGNNGQTSSSPTAQTFLLGAFRNSAGTVQGFNTDQFSMGMMGAASMTATQAANFTTRIQTYLTAVGA